MELKIGTFNILNEKNVYGNLKCDTSKYDITDNEFRTGIIMQILGYNDYDVIFLQEVGLMFRNNTKSLSELGKKYHVILSTYKQNWLCTLINKNKFKNVKLIDPAAYKAKFTSDTILNAVLIIEAQLLNNKKISLINMHLMTEKENKKDTIELVAKYIIQPTIFNAIISGDMNDETNLFPGIKKLILGVIPAVTSYSLGSCISGKMVYKTMTPVYRKLDQIYVSNNMVIKKIQLYDDFDKKTFKLSSNGKFNTYGPPFCFMQDSNNNNNNIENCAVYPYKFAFDNLETKWPSDHVFVEASVTISEKPVSDLKPTSYVFVPGSSSSSSSRFPKFHENTDTDMYRKYLKYKIKYLDLASKPQ